VYALNLKHSSENNEILGGADPLYKGAGHAVSAIMTSTKPTPRSPRLHRAEQRWIINRASNVQGSWGSDREVSTRVGRSI